MKKVPVETREAAVDAVACGMSERMAAKTYEVTRGSVRRRVLGLVPLDARRGPQLVYITEGADQGIVEMVRYRALHGMSVGYEELCRMIRTAEEATGTRPLTEDFPNNEFIQRWMKKHPDLSTRTAHLLDVNHAAASTPAVVMHHFNNPMSVLEKLDLLDKPIASGTVTRRVFALKGEIDRGLSAQKACALMFSAPPDRENVSIMTCVSATGERMPPLYIFMGVNKKQQWMERAGEAARCTTSERANINGELFLYWFKRFVSCLPPERPRLLLLDGHYAHIRIDVAKYGAENNVHPRVWTVQTPLRGSTQAIPKTKRRKLPIKDDIAGIASEPLIKACCPDNAKKGFKDTGVYPLSLDTMMKKIIGNKPCVSRATMPHISVILGQRIPFANPLEVTDRQQRVLRKLSSNVDALNVVNLLSSKVLAPRPQKRQRGDWVDETYSGGQLLSYDMMRAAAKAKAATQAQKQANKASAPLEKRAREAMNMHDQVDHQTGKSKKTIEKCERAAAKLKQKAERIAAKEFVKAQRAASGATQQHRQQGCSSVGQASGSLHGVMSVVV